MSWIVGAFFETFICFNNFAHAPCIYVCYAAIESPFYIFCCKYVVCLSCLNFFNVSLNQLCLKNYANKAKETRTYIIYKCTRI